MKIDLQLAWVPAAVLLGCAGCQAVPAYLVNETDTTLTVSVSMSRVDSLDGRAISACRIDPDRPMTVGRGDQIEHGHWVPVTLDQYDPQRCAATFRLPSAWAILLYRGGTCSDYRHGSRRQVVATIERLSIEGSSHSIRLTGFDTALAFKASSSHRDCRFVIK